MNKKLTPVKNIVINNECDYGSFDFGGWKYYLESNSKIIIKMDNNVWVFFLMIMYDAFVGFHIDSIFIKAQD